MARKVEDLGYSTVFIPDHFTDQWAPMVALTVAAEATTTLNVGTLVLGNDYRHPVVARQGGRHLGPRVGGKARARHRGGMAGDRLRAVGHRV